MIDSNPIRINSSDKCTQTFFPASGKSSGGDGGDVYLVQGAMISLEKAKDAAPSNAQPDEEPVKDEEPQAEDDTE